MGITVRVPIALGTIVGLTLVLSATPGHAYTTTERQVQKNYAIETVGLSYTDFIKRKADFQQAGCRKENYVYKGYHTPGCTKPQPYDAFDWTDDGCSGRDQIGGPSNVYRNLFNQPCQLHDFGYRNFGNGLQLDRTETRRAWIDSRFLTEMRRVCDTSFANNRYKRTLCRIEADGVYAVVRNGSNWNTPGGPTASIAPDPAPAPAPRSAQPVYAVVNTSETPPDGVWFRDSPHTADTPRITGLGVYMNERVRARCYAMGDAVGPHGNRVWYLADNISRPTAAGRSDSGWLNTHYVDDAMTADHPAPGIPAC
ncbi:phospholipase A2 [Actinomadura formosensis]|uniref:phospholipase A2 n=1 Tax=Actinomadura formosensis TaxID=60706 RepID=UPI003D8EF584